VSGNEQARVTLPKMKKRETNLPLSKRSFQSFQAKPLDPGAKSFFGLQHTNSDDKTRHTQSPDRLNSGGLKAAVAGDERQAKVEGRCGNDAVRHVGNNVSGYAFQGRSDVTVERNNPERGPLAVQLAHKPAERIGCNASALNQVNDFNQRNRGKVSWSAAGSGPVD
jgi:hypothetical protein